MPPSTYSYGKDLNDRYCAEFDVDYFKAEMMIMENPVLRRTETRWYFFNLFCSEEVKSFYRWMFAWRKHGQEFRTILDPIVKKRIVKKDIIYYLDEVAMRKELKKLITNNTKEQENGLHTGDS